MVRREENIIQHKVNNNFKHINFMELKFAYCCAKKGFCSSFTLHASPKLANQLKNACYSGCPALKYVIYFPLWLYNNFILLYKIECYIELYQREKSDITPIKI